MTAPQSETCAQCGGEWDAFFGVKHDIDCPEMIAEIAAMTAPQSPPTSGECPSDDCAYCTGEACVRCLTRDERAKCEHDVLDRHYMILAAPVAPSAPEPQARRWLCDYALAVENDDRVAQERIAGEVVAALRAEREAGKAKDHAICSLLDSILAVRTAQNECGPREEQESLWAQDNAMENARAALATPGGTEP